MNRRHFSKAIGLGLLALPGFSASRWRDDPTLMTVTGAVKASSLGICLPHEHLFSSFGIDEPVLTEAESDEIVREVSKYLAHVKSLGVTAVMDCTAMNFGRNPALLKRISENTGVKILTNTGYYGAADDRYVPPSAFGESVGEIVDRWLAEWQSGIGGTGIKPGFMKIGVDAGKLSAIDRKIVQAACRLHLKTGLTIACHTSGEDGVAAMDEMQVLNEEGVSPSAWIWVHAQNCQDWDLVAAAARRGGWVELDGLQAGFLDRHLSIVKRLKKDRLLHRVLLSHDGNSFRIKSDSIRPYDLLLKSFIPTLKKEGFTDKEIRLMTVLNPRQAFGIRVRKSE